MMGQSAVTWRAKWQGTTELELEAPVRPTILTQVFSRLKVEKTEWTFAETMRIMRTLMGRDSKQNEAVRDRRGCVLLVGVCLKS